MRDANRHVDGTDNLFSIYLDLILYRVLRGFKHSPKTRFMVRPLFLIMPSL